jgi:pyruvate dehydrogenase E1 component alpha subunit/2-oxoisovalerate dehydrogenase E1 component alpha subunit
MIPVVNGTLLARRFRGITGTVGVASIGEGATSTGAFHEAINQAAVERLPLVLVVANNQYAYSTPTRAQFACSDLYDKAIGYGVEGHRVDGTNLGDCLEVVGGAIERARQGAGPQLVVAQLLRLVGHGEHDDAHYIDPALLKSDLGRDCLRLAEEHILREGFASPAELKAWCEETDRQVDEAVAQTMRDAAPDPTEEVWSAYATAGLDDGFACA